MQLSPDFFDWISSHLSDDVMRLRLKYGAERAFEILQIECRRKYASKLHDTLSSNPNFIFPTSLSGEQSTSDALARYHASLVPVGGRVVDLTAGLGIDAMTIARKSDIAVALERDTAVVVALAENCRESNLTVVQCDCCDFVRDQAREKNHCDVMFIDPARRAADGSRTYALNDCEPDVVEMLPDLECITDMLIIKASPMLDITATLHLLPCATEVIAVGTTTECKELVFVCRFGQEAVAEPIVKAVTVFDDHFDEFAFTRSEETVAVAELATPQVGQYVYDPYPSVMKSGCYKLLAQRFGLTKPHPNTNLWFGDKLVDNFPGHVFRVEEVVPYASKNIKRFASQHPRASLSTRNFDVSADILRAKLKIKDGDPRLFAVTDLVVGKLLVLCGTL